MKKLICAVIVISICFTAVICGCSSEGQRSYSLYLGKNLAEAYYFSMNSDAVLTVYEGGNTASKKENNRIKELADGVYDILGDIENAVSTTVENSDISRFNAAEAGEEIQISKIAYDVLDIAKNIYERTGGYYNPAVYYGVQAFGFNSSARYPETEDELPAKQVTDKYASLASHFSDVELEERDGKYFVTKPSHTVEVDNEELNLKLDLGGIGKGYATDRVSDYLDKKGCNSAIFNFGGSSLSAKTYRGGNFNFSFADPRAEGGAEAYISNVRLQNKCVSTSGDYVNCFEINGVRYSHIFDPFTARPVQTGVMTATVIGGSAAENDGYTTAIMAMGAHKAIDFIESVYFSDCRVAFTFESGGEYYYYTNMSESDYTLSGVRYRLYGGGNVA